MAFCVILFLGDFMFKNKHIRIYIVVITLILLGIFFFGFRVYNKYTLDSEVKKILNKNLNSDNFNKKTKTFFEYGKVELAIKSYLYDYSNYVKKANKIVNDKEIKAILSASNYAKDGPNFEKSVELLNKKKEEFNKIISYLNNMSDEKVILSYIEKEKVGSEFLEIYKNYMLSKNNLDDLEKNKKLIKEISDKGLLIFDTDIEVLNLLKNNSDKWVVKDNKIGFYSNSVMETYNNLIQKVK